MAPPKIFAALVVAALSICGASAGPCRPITTTVATSTTATATTSTAAPTSTAPTCNSEQIVINPGFEDNEGFPWTVTGSLDNFGHNSDNAVRFETNADGGGSVLQTLYNVKPGTYQLSFAYTVKGWSPYSSDAGLNCNWDAYMGDQHVAHANSWGEVFFPSWKTSGASWTTTGADHVDIQINGFCSGEYSYIAFLVDDITLTRQCEIYG
ncbi:hypothetical protein BGZ63DRAFT_462213 [Mariannaea sp. PMI_226]|nr:hypothetical protein BGZ63DRAFT_462213 [Mariannaea sp. PMI_226]